MKTAARTTTTPIEAAAICTVCFGWAIASSAQFILSDSDSADFSDAGSVGLIVMELFCACVALLVLHVRNYEIKSLYPGPSLKGVGVALLLFLAAWLAGWAFTAPFASSLGEQPIDVLMDNATTSLPTVIATAVVNGAYEEVFLLGFLLRGLRGYGLSVALGVSLFVRALFHLYQGPLGVISVLAFGLVLSLYYIRSTSLFPVVFAHVLADIAPFLWP